MDKGFMTDLTYNLSSKKKSFFVHGIKTYTQANLPGSIYLL